MTDPQNPKPASDKPIAKAEYVTTAMARKLAPSIKLLANLAHIATTGVTLEEEEDLKKRTREEIIEDVSAKIAKHDAQVAAMNKAWEEAEKSQAEGKPPTTTAIVRVLRQHPMDKLIAYGACVSLATYLSGSEGGSIDFSNREEAEKEMKRREEEIAQRPIEQFSARTHQLERSLELMQMQAEGKIHIKTAAGEFIRLDGKNANQSDDGLLYAEGGEPLFKYSTDTPVLNDLDLSTLLQRATIFFEDVQPQLNLPMSPQKAAEQLLASGTQQAVTPTQKLLDGGQQTPRDHAQKPDKRELGG